jgi:hypothetical protein
MRKAAFRPRLLTLGNFKATSQDQLEMTLAQQAKSFNTLAGI